MDQADFEAYRRGHLFREKVFADYEKDILKVYRMNEFQNLNMSAVYDYLEEKYGTLPGSEQTLRNYIGYLIQTDRLRLKEHLRVYHKVPELPFGQQMQLDFGQYRQKRGPKLYLVAAVLSASRYKYVAFQDHPFSTTDVISQLLDCCEYFGGLPQELVIDQDHLMVVSENAGDILYTEKFTYFIQEQHLRMYVCRKADPETKGKIENLIKYVKRNFLAVRTFTSAHEANERALVWLKRRANGKISQATTQIPALLIEEERTHLRSVSPSIFRKHSLRDREERVASEKGYISVAASSYQLPLKYRNKTVEIYIADQKLFVFDRYTGGQIAEYGLSLIPGRVVSTRAHRRERDTSVSELKTFVSRMFASKQWTRFVTQNFKAFPRYVRDQCLEAKRYFLTPDIDRALLEEALTYCLENETLSFSNLHDTYTHWVRGRRRSPERVLELPLRERTGPGVPAPVRVTQRSVSVYEALIRTHQGGDR